MLKILENLVGKIISGFKIDNVYGGSASYVR